MPVIEAKVPGESALSFFDRLLGTDIKATDEQARVQFNRLLDSVKCPASKLLEQLNLSSERLGSTVREFDRLKTSTIEMPAFHDHVGDMNRRMAKERSEDRKIAQLTGEMTKQSAEMLQELVSTAGIFLVRFDERDEKSDGQIRILALSVLLSGFGVWFAAKAYYQDAAKNAADENAAHVQIERDNRIGHLLEQQLKALESAQADSRKLEGKAETKSKPPEKQ